MPGAGAANRAMAGASTAAPLDAAHEMGVRVEVGVDTAARDPQDRMVYLNALYGRLVSHPAFGCFVVGDYRDLIQTIETNHGR